MEYCIQDLGFLYGNFALSSYYNFIRLGIDIALTHHTPEQRNHRKCEKLERIKEAREGETKGRGQQQLKINKTKKEKKQLLFVWTLTYNLSNFSGSTRNMKVPASIACKIIEIPVCNIMNIVVWYSQLRKKKVWRV